MILKQGHTYRAMPHDGKLIAYIYRGGRCYYKDSPYSLAATQALKAAFPQYWTAIRDYGYAHPQLVPFINEDPMLIVSLVEVGKTRWLVGDGKAYIQSGLVMKDINYQFELYTQWSGTDTEQFATYFGFMGSDNNLPRFGLHNFNGRIMFGTNYTNTTGILVDSNSWIYSYKANTGEVSRKAIGEDFTTLGNAGTDDTFFNSNQLQLYIFARNYNGFNNGMAAKISRLFVAREEEYIAKYVPFDSEIQGAGMIDIVSLTFYPNAKTQGTFTIEITDKE